MRHVHVRTFWLRHGPVATSSGLSCGQARAGVADRVAVAELPDNGCVNFKASNNSQATFSKFVYSVGGARKASGPEPH